MFVSLRPGKHFKILRSCYSFESRVMLDEGTPKAMVTQMYKQLFGTSGSGGNRQRRLRDKERRLETGLITAPKYIGVWGKNRLRSLTFVVNGFPRLQTNTIEKGSGAQIKNAAFIFMKGIQPIMAFTFKEYSGN